MKSIKAILPRWAITIADERTEEVAEYHIDYEYNTDTQELIRTQVKSLSEEQEQKSGMRQNEFVADEYAYKLGYGAILASVLDRHICSTPENGLLKALYSTHPHSDDRVARLQELGANYSRY